MLAAWVCGWQCWFVGQDMVCWPMVCWSTTYLVQTFMSPLRMNYNKFGDPLNLFSRNHQVKFSVCAILYLGKIVKWCKQLGCFAVPIKCNINTLLYHMPLKLLWYGKAMKGALAKCIEIQMDGLLKNKLNTGVIGHIVLFTIALFSFRAPTLKHQ